MKRPAGLRSILTVTLAGALLGTLLVSAPGVATGAVGDPVNAGLIEGAGPLSRIEISPDLNCDVRYESDISPVFYGSTACATLIAVGGELFGPASIPAGGNAGPRTAFTPISQARTGDGSITAPYVIRTEVTAGGSGVRVVQEDIYFAGDDRYATAISIYNDGPAEADVKVWRAGDCYLANSDLGLGAVGRNWVACYSQTTNRILQWIDDYSSGATKYEANYSAVWAKIGAQELFDDTCECGVYQDNGAGLSWSRTIPAGGASLVSHHTAFSSATESIDTDGDGLPDEWEINGTPGGINLAALGASPNRKDLFLYLDWLGWGGASFWEYMGNVQTVTRPSDAVVSELVNQFAIAPIDNPDGSRGVSLHVRVPEDGLSFRNYIADGGNNEVLAAAETLADSRLSAAERKIYRYGLVGAYLSAEGSTGLGELPGDVFTAARKKVNTFSTSNRALSGTIAHEFGHNLGLGHGGPISGVYRLPGDSSNANCKPDYFSVMNYLFQIGGARGEVTGVDYSRRTADVVDYRHVDCPTSFMVTADDYTVNNDWSNLQYQAGRIGQLASGVLLPDEIPAEPTSEDFWEIGLRGNDGDGSIAVSSPTVFIAGSDVSEQKLFFRVQNDGNVAASYRLEVTIDGSTQSQTVNLASGGTAELGFPYQTSELPPVGEYDLHASLINPVTGVVVGEYDSVVGVFAPDAAAIESATNALVNNPAPDFTPTGIRYFQTVLDGDDAPTQPPTSSPTPSQEPSDVPTPTPHASTTADAIPAGSTNGPLASTGIIFDPWWIVAGVMTIVVGVSLVVLAILRRRKLN